MSFFKDHIFKIRGKQVFLRQGRSTLLAGPSGYVPVGEWQQGCLLQGGPTPPQPFALPPSLLCLALQEVLPAAEGAAGPEDTHCTGSTINLRDLQ